MNKDKLIQELLSAGATPEEIYALAQNRQNQTKERQKYRKAVLSAIFKYIKYLIPDVEITDQDMDNMNEYLKEFEERLEAFVGAAGEQEKEESEEDPIKAFLIKLGC
jgi:hypothetical protein